MKKNGSIIGWVLIGMSLLSCFLSAISAKKPAADAFSGSGRSGAYATPVPPDGTVSVNFAGAEELLVLPGVGETLASAILEERTKNGPFHYPEDLMAVKGIGKAKLAAIRPLLDMSEEE